MLTDILFAASSAIDLSPHPTMGGTSSRGRGIKERSRFSGRVPTRAQKSLISVRHFSAQLPKAICSKYKDIVGTIA